MAVSPVTESTNAVVGSQTGGFGAVTTEDFLNLMITELQNQDPLEPASNEQLMQLLASFSQMEMTSRLTESMQTLVESQRYGSAAALVGQYVRGPEPESGELPIEGVVRSLRFTDDGSVVLELVGGKGLPLESLTEVAGLEELIGQYVEFITVDGEDNVVQVLGQVIGVGMSDAGEPYLDVDVGAEESLVVPMRNVVALSGGLEV